MHLLTFSLDGKRYGLDAAAVRLIERAVAITPLPRAPSLVEGVIDVHGTITPVFDLRRRFGHEARPLRANEHVVIAAAGERQVAFRVDEALDLLVVSDDVVPVPPLGGGPAGEGIARLGDGAVAIYDLATFLTESERSALDAALEASTSAVSG